MQESDPHSTERPDELPEGDLVVMGLTARRMVDFYAPFFQSPENAYDFLAFCVGRYQKFPDMGPDFHVHSLADNFVTQAHTIVSLADSVQESDYLKLVLLMTLAESTAKIWFNYHQDGQSRRYCREFFLDLCPEPCRYVLLRIAEFDNSRSLDENVRQMVDFLYNERCVAIHSGRLDPWYTFPHYDPIRHAVASACIETARKSFDRDCVAAACPGHNRSWGLLCSPYNCSYSSFRSDR